MRDDGEPISHGQLPSDVQAATYELNTFVLRGLGYEGDLSHD